MGFLQEWINSLLKHHHAYCTYNIIFVVTVEFFLEIKNSGLKCTIVVMYGMLSLCWIILQFWNTSYIVQSIVWQTIPNCLSIIGLRKWKTVKQKADHGNDSTLIR